MSRPIIGEAGVERARRMGRRRWGVTVPEVAEAFEVPYYTAHRFVQKLVREGVLKRTKQRRRRTEIFEKVHGAGGVVYRSTRSQLYAEQVEWSQRWPRKRRRSRRATG